MQAPQTRCSWITLTDSPERFVPRVLEISIIWESIPHRFDGSKQKEFGISNGESRLWKWIGNSADVLSGFTRDHSDQHGAHLLEFLEQKVRAATKGIGHGVYSHLFKKSFALETLKTPRVFETNCWRTALKCLSQEGKKAVKRYYTDKTLSG